MNRKVLNLYAGIGGNRKLWTDVEVTAVEINPEIAKIYQDFFPDDKVVVEDAHQYLLEHYDDGWDFFWSSPPCKTHSRQLYALGIKGHGYPPIYPDMRLYEEIIFLRLYCPVDWVVENVMPYYGVFIPATLIGRHLFWSNFHISQVPGIINMKDKMLNGNQLMRNCVKPKLGKHIFDCAFKLKQTTLGVGGSQIAP